MDDHNTTDALVAFYNNITFYEMKWVHYFVGIFGHVSVIPGFLWVYLVWDMGVVLVQGHGHQ